MYREENLVRIAKRENNKKRNYLVVNRLQGKHIPVKPHEALDMFKELAAPLKKHYTGERLLLIGFAETATAIGAAVALELEAAYMQTTREQVPDVNYLYFSEDHSHATEQKLVKNDIDGVIYDIDRIIFIEDEVTTGKTILNIINILETLYPDTVHFSVASVLNGMGEDALEVYESRGIKLHWLVKTNHAAYADKADLYRGDGKYIVCSAQNSISNNIQEKPLYTIDGCPEKIMLENLKEDRFQTVDIWNIRQKMGQFMNTRRLVEAKQYADFCERLYLDILSWIDLKHINRLLVLGTEEFMYPPLYVAERLENQGKEVWFHATTRSPITVSTEKEYPLHVRYALKSFYDAERVTYIYNLDKYDYVLVITDSNGELKEGFRSLRDALLLSGNEHIVFVY